MFRKKPKEKKLKKEKLQSEKISELAKEIGAPILLQSDVKILRDRLSWACRKSPPTIQAQITESLLRFAKAIQPYCQCPEKVYLANEKRYRCLDCGANHRTLEGDPKLKVV